MNVTQPGPYSALNGILNGQNRVHRAAAEIAAPQAGDLDPGRLVQAVVELKQGELQVRASAKALQAQNDSIGTLLDEKA